MRTILSKIIVCLCTLLLSYSPSYGLNKKTLRKHYKPKYAAIVIDADTGKVLDNEDADGIRHPASLTKMMTLYIVFEALRSGRLKLSTQMTVSSKASRQSPSKLGLKPGEKISVYNAIMGLATKSANDVAVVIAEHLSGSEEAFARRMTQKAQALRMNKTIFKNASGLPNPGQVTTARDMAHLSQAIYRDFPKEYQYFRHQTFSYKGAVHRNHNHLLGKVSGLDGIKTGFIAASGFNIAVSAARQDASGKKHRLIAIVLGGENRHWRDRRATQLLETHFDRMGLSATNNAKVQQLVLHKAEPEVVEAIDNKADSFEELIYEATYGQLTEEDEDDVIAGVIQEVSSSNPRGWVKPKLTAVEAPSNVPKKQPADYLVQVGQFRRQSEAKSMARKPRQLTAAGHPEAVKVRKNGKYYYVARVSKLTRLQASDVCQKWSRKGSSCQNLGRLR